MFDAWLNHILITTGVLLTLILVASIITKIREKKK